MDPDACLQRFLDALEDNDSAEAWGAHLDLSTWLARGGFEPSDADGLAVFRAWKRLDKYTSGESIESAYGSAEEIADERSPDDWKNHAE